MNLKESFRFRARQLILVARKLYIRVPTSLRWVAFPLVYFYRFCRLVPKLRMKIWILSGEERSTQKLLSILYATNDRNNQPIVHMNYMVGLIFNENYQKVNLGQSWIWNIRKVIAKNGQGCSLMVIQVYKPLLKLLKPSNWFHIPLWVEGEIDIPAIPNSENLRRNLRKIQKQPIGFEVTQNPQKFDDFYYNMYVPYITTAHGSSAYIMPYEEKKNKFQNCELLLVKNQEKSIAGTLIAYERGDVRLWSQGIRDGNLEYLKEGAATAFYHFSLNYLEDKGFTKIKSGLSRAFLRDGVLQYKRKWSQKIAGTSRDWFALKVLSYNDAAAGAFLQKNPFIFEKRGTLNGAVFVDGDDSFSHKEIRRIYKQHYHTGLAKLFIYHLPHGNTIKKDNIPTELFGRIVCCSVNDAI